MAFTQLFYAYRPLDNLPVELVAEISSQLDQDEENCICRDRKKPSKDLLNFALVSRRYGAVASRTLFRDVYGARNWDEHIPQDAGSDMEKLNLAPLHSAWELLLGTANPLSYIHSVTLAPPRGTQDTYFRVSPNKLREALLSLPCLKEVCFRQTEMLDDPVVVSGASSRLLTVSNVRISQLDGGVVGDETHLPRLLGIFDEIGTLEYSSDHSQITYEEAPEPRRSRVKVSMLKFLPTRDGCPVGALKAINALVELSTTTEMSIVMQDWSNYLWCGKRLNEMVRGASNLQALSLVMPQPLGTMQGAPNDANLDPDMDAEDGGMDVDTASVSDVTRDEDDANSAAGDSEVGSFTDDENDADFDMDEDTESEAELDENFDPEENIDLSYSNLQHLNLNISAFGDSAIWEKNLAALRTVASSSITHVHVHVNPGTCGETLAHYKSYLPDFHGLADYAEELKTMLCTAFPKLETFTIDSFCSQDIAEEMRNSIDTCFHGSRAQALCKWDIETWDDFQKLCESMEKDESPAPASQNEEPQELTLDFLLHDDFLAD